MSINSLFSAGARAEKLSIGDILKGVQSGSIPSFVGIPLIEKKTKEAQKMQAMQALMRQMEGGPPSTVTDRVMQAADQVTRPENPLTPTSLATGRQQPAPNMGIEMAQSNMPQEYAGGGIVAFADTGVVKAGAPDDEELPGGGFARGYELLKRKAAGWMPEPGTEGAADEGAGGMFRSLFTRPKASPTFTVPGSFTPEDFVDTDNDYESYRQQQAANKAPQPQTPPANTGLKIERGVEAPPDLGAPKDPASSAFSGIEDIYKSYLDRSRADRDELRSMILGQKADRAEQAAENRNTALMKAGFGMMAGQSPFAGVNIGRGAMEGAESYGKGLEQLRRDDRSTIQQLASLGLKGQELEQAAMKMGIDMSHYKMLEPYYTSAAEENRAKAGLYPKQGQLAEAEGIRQLASANKDVVETTLLPGQSESDRIKAEAQRANALRGDSKPPSDKFLHDLRTEREAIIQDPLNSGLDLDPEIKKALSLPGTPSFQRAKEWVKQEAYRRYNQALRERNYAVGYME